MCLEVRPVTLLFLGGYTAFTQFSSDIAVKGVRAQKNFSPTSTLNRRPTGQHKTQDCAVLLNWAADGRQGGPLECRFFGTSLASLFLRREIGTMTDNEKKIRNGNLARNDGYPHWNYFGLGGVAAGVAPLVVTDGR